MSRATDDEEMESDDSKTERTMLVGVLSCSTWQRAVPHQKTPFMTCPGVSASFASAFLSWGADKHKKTSKQGDFETEILRRKESS